MLEVDNPDGGLNAITVIAKPGEVAVQPDGLVTVKL
jgi:hypothetical protein